MRRFESPGSSRRTRSARAEICSIFDFIDADGDGVVEIIITPNGGLSNTTMVFAVEDNAVSELLSFNCSLKTLHA